MDDNYRGSVPQMRCAGCGLTLNLAGARVLLADGRALGHACAQCFKRARRKPLFSTQLQIAALAGTSVAEMARIFASVGALEVPTTVEGCAAAVGYGVTLQ
jgi:hypothetical protein